MNLPPIGHLTQGCGVQCRRYVGIDRLYRRKDGQKRLLHAQCIGQIDSVLTDVRLRRQIRRNVDGRIGDQQQLGIGGHVHGENVAYPPFRPDSGAARHHRAQHFVRVQGALHENFRFALMHHLHRPGRRRVAVRHIDNPVGLEIQPLLLGHRPDTRLRPDQQRFDHAGLRRLHGTRQRDRIAGVDHRRGDRFQPLHRLQERRVAVMMAHRDLGQFRLRQ